MQNKQVDSEMNSKKTFFKKTFPHVFGRLHTKEYKAKQK